ncbi:hypothetical protein A0H81_05565 [Grifola frondosa]|uniref:Uncharacterized protein n=1 Tax=Grifola frondosa TaxID=5627 RepID=A0A1C7MEM7_GRIFR|nr:hypothetical protein A0H81_05565 [Grifola frondosa]
MRIDSFTITVISVSLDYTQRNIPERNFHSAKHKSTVGNKIVDSAPQQKIIRTYRSSALSSSLSYLDWARNVTCALPYFSSFRGRELLTWRAAESKGPLPLFLTITPSCSPDIQSLICITIVISIYHSHLPSHIQGS